MQVSEPSGMEDYIHLSFFMDVAKAIASASTINETLKAVMTHIGNIFAPLNWSLLLRNARTGELTFRIVVGSGVQKILGTTIPKGQGIAGWIAENGQAIIIEDVARDPRFDSSVDRALGFTTESIIGVPLKTRDRVFGVIELINKVKGGNFTPLELKVLATIGDFAAIAIEKAYYHRALRRIALIDPLTGVHNRRSMIRFLDREVDRSARLKSELSVLMVDIDKFKEINDNYGHAAGDAVLHHLAGVLQKNLRKIDIICRYGGDEFVVLMPDTSAPAAQDVRRRVEEAVKGVEVPAPLNYEVSVGLYSGHPSTASEIFTSADFDMYREKSSKIDQEIDNLSQNLGEFLDEEEGEEKPPRPAGDRRT
ncbi:MAG TPA: sensor domain-containing diguanylate cyclase [Spirochaetia bacterium]|nr:sensor domain-containing diguanylate cyclase [Spirochaetia bacterium]